MFFIWYILCLGHFVAGTFFSWDILSTTIRKFCSQDVWRIRTLCIWDILCLGRFVVRTFCLQTFCFGTFCRCIIKAPAQNLVFKCIGC
jgi:hypothetical protein